MRFTRIHYAVLAALMLAFGIITVVKHMPTAGETAAVEKPGEPDRQKRVRRFWTHYNQAARYRTAGKLEAAAVRYRRALALNPNHENALYYLGNVYAGLGRLVSAETTWARLVAANPSSARAYVQLGDLYYCADTTAFFDLHRAQAAYKRALAIHNEETRPLLRLAEIALVREAWGRARHYLDAVLGSNYQSAEAYLLSGYLAWRAGAMREATTQQVRAARLARESPGLKLREEGEAEAAASKAGTSGRSIFLDCPLGEPLRALRERASATLSPPAVTYEQVASIFDRLRQRAKSKASKGGGGEPQPGQRAAPAAR